MSKHTITDKDVVYQIAQILVRQFSHLRIRKIRSWKKWWKI
jgi:hypothetical protein